MRNLSTIGIILKKNNFNESDQFITFYSPDLGKIDAVVKGSRKIESAYTGHLEILNICRFQLYKNNERFLITQCQSFKIFKNLHSNLDKAVLGLMLGEIIQKSTHMLDDDAKLFKLIESSLENLNKNNDDFLNLESFKIKLLDLLGLMPDVSRCTFCQKKWTNENIILINEEFHLSCSDCQTKNYINKVYQQIDFGIIKLLHFLKLNELPINQKIKLKTVEAQTLQNITNRLLKQYIDRELNSELLLSNI